MVERFTRTIVSFLIVLSAYWLYALFVVPWVDPTESTRQAPSPLAADVDDDHQENADSTGRFRHLLEPLFAADSWERKRAIVLKNDQFLLLINGYETLNDVRQLKLKRCTLVLNPESATISGTEETESCVILTAPEGAVLEFDRPFAITSGGLGKLVGGRLVGKVFIRSHSVNQSGDPDQQSDTTTSRLEIITRNVQMNSQQIWTPNEVQFRYGQNSGAGRDLMINMGEVESNDLRRLPSETPTHLRSLELVHLDHMTVTTDTQSSLTTASADGPVTLRIRCQGPLLFDFVGGYVMLNDQVAIQRISGPWASGQRSSPMSVGNQEGDPKDWLTCDLLAMQFQKDRPSTAGNQDPTTAAQPTWALPKFELSLISAIGSPAAIDAPTYKVRAQAERIELQLSHNRLLLQDPKQATLEYDSHTFQAHATAQKPARMEYFFDPQRGPGRAVVDGGGHYLGTLDEDIVRLDWQEGFKFGPRDGSYLLEVDGETLIQWGKRTPQTTNVPLANQLAAGHLQVWLRQRERKRADLGPVAHRDESEFQLNPPRAAGPRSPIPVQPSASANAPRDSLERITDRWRPGQLIARKNVRLRTPQLAGDVEFAKITLREHFETPRADSKEDGPALIDPLGSASRGSAGNERYQLSGHEVHVVLHENGDGQTPGFDTLTIKGGVQLRQLTDNPKLDALEIQGDIVELDQSTGAGTVGRVSGSPATIKTRGVELTGRDIRVDQSLNRVWIDDAGSAYLPLPSRIAMQYARPNATMQIAWQGKMVFDGESVVCDQGVEIRGPAQHATADTLKATLVETVRFDNLQFQQDRMKNRRPDQVLAEVSLSGNVQLKNHSFDDDGLTSIDEIQVHSLTFNQATNMLVGKGPGVMSSVRYTKRRAARANPPNTKNGTLQNQLTHTLIEFQKQLTGNLAKRELSVYDRVKAIHGPIQDWQQRLRMDAATQSPETIHMQAMRMTVSQMISGRQRSLEFVASGNTEIAGSTFLARAQHVRYMQANDQLVLEGDSRSGAEIYHQSRIGAPRARAEARKITYRIRENKLKAWGVAFSDLDGSASNQPASSSLIQQNHPGQTPSAPQHRGPAIGRVPQGLPLGPRRN